MCHICHLDPRDHCESQFFIGKRSIRMIPVLSPSLSCIGSTMNIANSKALKREKHNGNLRQRRFCGDACSKVWPGNRITVGSHIRVSRAEKLSKKRLPAEPVHNLCSGSDFFQSQGTLSVSLSSQVPLPTCGKRFIIFDTETTQSVLKKTKERLSSPFQRRQSVSP